MSFARSARFAVATAKKVIEPVSTTVRPSAEGKPRLASHKPGPSVAVKKVAAVRKPLAALGAAAVPVAVKAQAAVNERCRSRPLTKGVTPQDTRCPLPKELAGLKPVAKVSLKEPTASKKPICVTQTVVSVKPQTTQPAVVVRASKIQEPTGRRSGVIRKPQIPQETRNTAKPTSAVSTRTSTPAASTKPTPVCKPETLIQAVPRGLSAEPAVAVPPAPDRLAQTLVDAVFAEAVTQAYHAGISRAKIDLIQKKVREYQPHLTIEVGFQQFMRHIRADPYTVARMATDMRQRDGGILPVGLRNTGVICFLLAAMQAVISSAESMSVLVSEVLDSASPQFNLQRAFLAAISCFGEYSTTRTGEVLPVDVFVGSFFPDIARNRHFCSADALSRVFATVGNGVVCIPLGTAGMQGSIPLENLFSRDQVIMDLDLTYARSLHVSVTPYGEISGSDLNLESAIFKREMSLQGITWDLKAVVFWKPLSFAGYRPTAESGHYYTVALRGDQWWLLDDLTVQPVSGPEQLCRAGLGTVSVLIYDRV